MFADADGDGYGDPNVSIPAVCSQQGYVENSDDCNDNNGLAWTGATILVMASTTTVPVTNTMPLTPSWYADTDNDGYGDASDEFSACMQPSGYVADNTDCDDGNSSVPVSTT